LEKEVKNIERNKGRTTYFQPSFSGRNKLAQTAKQINLQISEKRTLMKSSLAAINKNIELKNTTKHNL